MSLTLDLLWCLLVTKRAARLCTISNFLMGFFEQCNTEHCSVVSCVYHFQISGLFSSVLIASTYSCPSSKVYFISNQNRIRIVYWRNVKLTMPHQWDGAWPEGISPELSQATHSYDVSAGEIRESWSSFQSLIVSF